MRYTRETILKRINEEIKVLEMELDLRFADKTYWDLNESERNIERRISGQLHECYWIKDMLEGK